MSAAGHPTVSANHSQTIFNLRQAFKLALSMLLMYWLALSQNWDVPKYGGLAIVIISLGTTGATIEKGILRFLGTIAGVSVGFLILGLFNHDRWATMLALSVHLTLMTYGMQASRYPYAWYAAGFIPLVIWGDNYPHFEKAFYFGTFRWLETTAGILIYTLVDLVFWPRQAGEQLFSQGRDLWAEVREQFRRYRAELDGRGGKLPAGDLRAKLAGTLTRMMATLQLAYQDTPTVSAQKRVWEVWRVNARALVDALEVWRESIDDCRTLDLDRLLLQLGPALDTLEKRLERIGVLWDAIRGGDDSQDAAAPLMEALTLDLENSEFEELSHLERAALMSCLGQLEVLDRSSRELLRTMRMLSGLESRRGLPAISQVRDFFRPSRWDPARLIYSLFPAATFIAGFVFWVLIYPPPGQKVPMVAAIFAIIIVRTPMPPLAVTKLWLLSMLFVIAPIYFLLMPALSTGFGLLSLIFVYSFVFGYLGGRSPALKSGAMMTFVLMTGISNRQSYSFEGLVDGALMLILAGAIMTVVYYFFRPMRPEQALLRSLRRFFHGCAGVIGGIALDGPAERAKERRRRKRYFESMVLPAPAKIRTAQNSLEYKLYPDNDADKVQRLHDSVQSIAYRLESLELAHQHLARHASEFPASLISLGRELGATLQRVFDRWASFDPGDAFQHDRDQLQRLSRDLQHQLDTLETEQDQVRPSDERLTDLYTLIGCVRGSVAAMANAQNAINQINWQQWATTRF